YTNGENAWNGLNQPLANGSNLAGSQDVTQSSLIIPYPGIATQYLMFTLNKTIDTSGFCYSIVDMTMDGGRGGVMFGQKNIELLEGNPVNQLTEKMAATEHCNGTDYWVVVHRYNSNQFIVYPVTSAGIGAPTT